MRRLVAALLCALLMLAAAAPALGETIEVYASQHPVEADGWYDTMEEVAVYLCDYGELPGNFITKQEARSLGWDAQKGNLWDVAEGCSIGGDRFGNYEGSLPSAKGRTWTECDIGYDGGYRGGERIVFSNDGLIYYTDDHYATFDEIEVDDSGMVDSGLEQGETLERELGALFDWLFGE